MSELSRRLRLLPSFVWWLGAWLLISFALRVYLLDNLRWTYDEGLHVLFVQLLARGYEPYREVFVSYPPLYTLSMDWTWRLFGTVESLQLLMTLYTLFGLAAVGFLGWRLGGSLAGLTAAVVLSLEPEVFRGSRGVLTEIPSLGFGAVSVALAACYLWAPAHHKGRRWLVASGIALAASLMLKIITPFVPGVIGLMILVRQTRLHLPTLSRRELQQRWPTVLRAVVIDSLWWGLALLLPIIALILIYDVPGFIDQAILFRFATRGAYEGEINNFLYMLTALRSNWPLTLTGGLGLLFWWRHRRAEGWFVPAWLLLSMAFALMQVPLRDKHLPLLIVPLSVLSGLGVGWLWQSLRQGTGRWAVLSGLTLLLLGGSYLWQTATIYAGFQGDELVYLSEDEQNLAAYLQRFTAPDDCLITDDPTLAFIAERPVPPPLAEVSSARLRSGHLTAAQLSEIAAAHDCPVVAPVARRIQRSAQDFIGWTEQHYLTPWLYDGETVVFLGKPIAHSQPQHGIQAQFADQVQLEGYDLWPVDEAGVAHLSLYWRPQQPFAADYTVFVQVRDARNNTLLSADHQPYDGLLPTTRWPVDALIKETIDLPVPPDMPPGTYRIFVGLYLFDGTNFNRLPLQNDVSGENAVIIEGFVRP